MDRSKISKHYKKAAKSVRIFEASVKETNKIVHSLQTEVHASSSTSSTPTYKYLDSTTISSSELLPDYSYVLSTGGNSYSSSSESSNINNEPDSFDAIKIVEPKPNENELLMDICSQSAPSITLCSQLSEWAVNHNITHVAINDILKILKPNFPELPNDARTLLHTPRTNVLKEIEPGKYYHFGLESCLKKLLKSVPIRTSLMSIEILINVDGLPLSSSSSSQFYPILCTLYGEKEVGIIGIYHGNNKPKDANLFLTDFVNEAIVLSNSYVYEGCQCSIKVKGFICDAPAKSFVKYTKGHSGYMSCTKCYTEGTYINGVSFPQVNNLKLRSDLEFRNKVQEEHHTGTSIIENIPRVDMIKSFPLDYMHLVCLGVVKKLISIWLNGKPGLKLSFRQVSHLSDLLIGQTPNVPVEFNRKPRDLNEYKRWKATEFRQFLLYSGPIVLKLILPRDKYIHFLPLHVAIRILSSEIHLSKIDYAEKLLHYFVERFIALYGAEYTSHNIHNLLHITNDVREFGPLDKFSAFPFENYMQTLKKNIRKQEKPLQQLINRVQEVNVSNGNKNSVNFPIYNKKHFRGPILNYPHSCHQYMEIKFQYFSLGLIEPNNCSLSNGSIISVKNIIQANNNQCFVVGEEFLVKENFYTEPCESSELGVYLVSHQSSIKSWNVNQILCKCFKMSYRDKFIVFPLVHIA